MIWAARFDAFVDAGDQIRAVRSEEREKAVHALLQVAVGVDGVVKILGVSSGALVAAQRFARDFALHFPDLIQNLCAAFFERFFEAGIEAPDGGGEGMQLVIDGELGGGELSGNAGGDETASHLLAEIDLGNGNVFQADIVALGEFGGATVEEGEAGAVGNDGHATQQHLVERLTLGEIREFGGTAEVGDGGQEVVLHDGAEDCVGAEKLGLGLEIGEWFVIKCFAGAFEDRSFAAFEGEEQRGIAFQVYLAVIAGDFEFAGAGLDGVNEFPGHGQSAAQEWRGDRAYGGLERVEVDYAVGLEDLFDKLAEGAAEGFAVPVGRLDKRHGFGGEVHAGQRLAERFQGDVLEGDVADGAVGRVDRGGGELDWVLIGVKCPGLIDFCKVVIFGGKPEDGDSAGALVREAPGQFDGG